MKDKLEEIFGKAYYSEKEVDTFVHSTDSSKVRGKCDGVTWPDSIEELQKMIRLVRRNSINLTIRGGASEGFGGTVPEEGLVIDTSRMNRILEIGKDFVIVEGGANIDFVNAHLKGMQIPVAPWNHKVATLGGMIAVNAMGTDKSVGPIGDYVMELEVIDGNGRYIKAQGSKLYEFVGYEGTTGIICRAKIRTTKVKIGSYSVFSYNNITPMIEKFMGLRENPSVQFMDFFDEYTSSRLDFEYKFHLIVKFKDDSGDIVALDEISKMNKIFDIIHVLMVMNKFRKRETLKVQLKHMGWLINWGRKNGIPCHGNFNIGIVTFYARDKFRLDQVYKVAKKINAKVGHGLPIGKTKRELVSQEDKKVLQAIKLKLDSGNILNRGVYIEQM